MLQTRVRIRIRCCNCLSINTNLHVWAAVTTPNYPSGMFGRKLILTHLLIKCFNARLPR